MAAGAAQRKGAEKAKKPNAVTPAAAIAAEPPLEVARGEGGKGSAKMVKKPLKASTETLHQATAQLDLATLVQGTDPALPSKAVVAPNQIPEGGAISRKAFADLQVRA